MSFLGDRPSGESSEPFAPANEVLAGWVRPAVLSAPVECARTGGLIGWEPFWWKPTKLSERIYKVRAAAFCRRKEPLPAIASRLRMYGLDGCCPPIPIWSIEELCWL
jgi:hypothetical protein